MKRPYLVLYDYHTGGVWAYLLAESPREILARYPQLHVYESSPDFLSQDNLENIASTMTIDIDDESDEFLKGLRGDLPKTKRTEGTL